jgi:hypothetical protein
LPAVNGGLAGACNGQLVGSSRFGDDRAGADGGTLPMVNGATSEELEPMKALSPIWVIDLFTPS